MGTQICYDIKTGSEIKIETTEEQATCPEGTRSTKPAQAAGTPAQVQDEVLIEGSDANNPGLLTEEPSSSSLGYGVRIHNPDLEPVPAGELPKVKDTITIRGMDNIMIGGILYGPGDEAILLVLAKRDLFGSSEAERIWTEFVWTDKPSQISWREERYLPYFTENLEATFAEDPHRGISFQSFTTGTIDAFDPGFAYGLTAVYNYDQLLEIQRLNAAAPDVYTLEPEIQTRLYQIIGDNRSWWEAAREQVNQE